MEFLLHLLAELFPTPSKGFEETDVKAVQKEPVLVEEEPATQPVPSDEELAGLFGLIRFH